MRTRLMAGACALTLGTVALSACGGDEPEAELPLAVEDEAGAPEAEAPAAPAAAPAAVVDPASEAYLAENAAREGVRVTDSGLQVETLEAGEGRSPTEQDIIRFSFEARKADGTVIAGSGEEVAVAPGYRALQLPGLIEAVPQMKEGERARISMPAALAFGDQAIPGAPVAPGEAVVFDMDLVEVIAPDDEARLAELQAEAEAEARAAVEENRVASEAFLASKRAEEGVQATGSGLLYEVVEDGGEGPSPAATDRVRVHYRGTLPDGTEFDSSYGRGQPTEFRLDQVIGGWTEGVQLMSAGDTYRFYIPSDLAYGEAGTPGGPIGPAQALVFDVELISVLEDEPESAAPAPAPAPAEE